jgi:hypothetical protein
VFHECDVISFTAISLFTIPTQYSVLYSYTVANIHMSKFKNMKHIKELRFKVCTKVKTKIMIFCVVTSYSLVCGYQLLP